jgi:hypothetical protein
MSYTDRLPLYNTPLKHNNSFLARWRFYCSAALFGGVVYVILFQLSYGFALPPPPATQVELLTDPRVPPRPDRLPQPRPPKDGERPLIAFNDDHDALDRLFNYHHLEMDELQGMVGRTKGFFARDYSLWLGWNNVRWP